MGLSVVFRSLERRSWLGGQASCTFQHPGFRAEVSNREHFNSFRVKLAYHLSYPFPVWFQNLLQSLWVWGLTGKRLGVGTKNLFQTSGHQTSTHHHYSILPPIIGSERLAMEVLRHAASSPLLNSPGVMLSLQLISLALNVSFARYLVLSFDCMCLILIVIGAATLPPGPAVSPAPN